MNEVLDYYSRHLEALAKANALNKPIVFDALKAAGLTLVEVEFDGEANSGQIEGIFEPKVRSVVPCARRMGARRPAFFAPPALASALSKTDPLLLV